jgi:hypothetical protein
MKLPRTNALGRRFAVALFAGLCCLCCLLWADRSGAQSQGLKPLQPCRDTSPAPRFDDFELVAQQFSPQSPPRDVNNFLLNPQWGWQTHNPVTGGATPKRENFPDSIDDKRCGDPCFRDCVGTKQAPPTWDGPLPFACVMCNLAQKRPHRELGHINWLTTTYTGRICFHNCSYPDMDYTFSLLPDGAAGLTRWNHPSRPENKEVPRAFHIEFDSRETVNRFKSPIWTDFGAKASPCVAKDVGVPGKGNSCHFEEARKMIEQRRAVVVGLFGLDSEHDIYSELHPVYAMAIETNPSKDDNTWIIFARNTGGEGACSVCDHPLECGQDGTLPVIPMGEFCPQIKNVATKLMLLIPPPEGATGDMEVSRTAGTVFYRNTSADPDIGYYKIPDTTEAKYTERNQGVLLTFTLDGCKDAGCIPLVEGELHLKWNKGPAALTPAQAAKAFNQKLDACILSSDVAENETGESERPTSAQAARLLTILAQERQQFTEQMIRASFTGEAAITEAQLATNVCAPFVGTLSIENRLKDMRDKIDKILRSKSK